MEWARCNSCGYYPSPLTRLSIFLTSCRHLVCSQCLQRATKPSMAPRGIVCLVCKQPCKMVQLGPHSRPGPGVTFLFGEPLSAIKKVQQTVMFQKMHQDVATEMAKRERLLSEIIKIHRQVKELTNLKKRIASSQIRAVLQVVQEKAISAGINPPTTRNKNSPCTGQVHASPSPGVSRQWNHNPFITSGRGYPAQGMRQGGSAMPTPSPSNKPPNGSSIVSSVTGQSGCAGDPRLRANLMSQIQMQNWAQKPLQCQQRPATGRAALTSIPATGAMHQMHSNPTTPSPALHHPLKSVYHKHTPASGIMSAISGGPRMIQAIAR